jgi:mRNA-degrading endonuclease toxin of MazEF toxin-antitoxin module
VALPAGSNINGVVMIQQLKSFDWRARNARIAGRGPQIVLGRAIAIVKLVIDAE